MTRDEFFASNQGERPYYERQAKRSPKRPIALPLTQDGFEALFQIVCSRAGVPADDAVRSALCGYVHHMPGTESYSTLSMLVQVVRKSYANNLTWLVDQACKLRAKEEAMAEAQAKVEEARKAKEALEGPPQGLHLVEGTPAPTPPARDSLEGK